MKYYLYSFLCVFFIAVGQILFKVAATLSMSTEENSFRIALATLFAALTIYAITTLGWVYILRNIELSKAYPIMALSFVIVPFGCHFILGESLSLGYFVGISLIVLGVFVAGIF